MRRSSEKESSRQDAKAQRTRPMSRIAPFATLRLCAKSVWVRTLLLCVLCAFVVSCSHQNGQSAKAATSDVVAVKAIEAHAENIARRVELVGTLEGDQEVTVSSEVAARVAAIRADLGDQVQAGQVVIELDPTQYRLAVDRQQGALAEALARLGLSKEDEAFPAPERSAVVRRATAERQDAKAKFDRAQNLAKE